MSVEAYTWALNLAPVPMDLGGKGPRPNPPCAFVLVGLANHAGPDGRDAFPSTSTLVRYTRLAERTVRTALDRLEEEAIIRPSDPAVVAAKIKRADKRPQGYDLAMELMRDDLDDRQLDEIARQNPWLRPWIEQHRPVIKAARERGAAAAPRRPRGAADDTHGVQPTQSRGAAAAPKPTKEPSMNRPTNQAPIIDRSPAELLAVEVLAGLEESNPGLAAGTGRPQLREVCQRLVDNGWQPAQVRAWVAGSWQNWGSVTSGGGVVHRLREVGRPPKEPEPVVQSQHECPVHPGVPLRVAADCDACREESRRVDTAAAAAAVRAARRPLLGSDPVTSPQGIDLTVAEGARA